MKKRYILGAALIAGAIIGQYLPNFWKGFGGGSTIGVGIGDPTSGDVSSKTGTQPAETPGEQPDTPKTAAPGSTPDSTNTAAVIKVVIDEKSYFVRSAAGDRPVTIPEIIALVQAATGDADGIRVRIYQKGTSRPSAEIALNEAFEQAKISNTAVVWVPTIVK